MNNERRGPGFCRTCHTRYRRDKIFLPRTACPLHREHVGFCQICRVDYDIEHGWALKTVCLMHIERGYCLICLERGLHPSYDITPNWQRRTRCPRHGTKRYYYCSSCDEEYEWTDDDHVWWAEGFHCPRGCPEEISAHFFNDDDEEIDAEEAGELVMDDDDDDDDEDEDEEMDENGEYHGPHHCRRGEIRRETQRCENCGRRFHLTIDHQVDELCERCIEDGVLDQEGLGLCSQCHRVFELEEGYLSNDLCQHCAARDCDYCGEQFYITEEWDREDICERCAIEQFEPPPSRNTCENCGELYEIDDVHDNELFCVRCEDLQTRPAVIAPPAPGQVWPPEAVRAEASRQAVQALVGKKLDKTMMWVDNLDEGEEAACAICRRDVPIGTKVRVLPCRHWYHGSCVRVWLEGSSRRCPTCRQPIPEPSRDQVLAYEERAAVRRARRAARRRARQTRANRRILAGEPAHEAITWTSKSSTRRRRHIIAPEDQEFVPEEEVTDDDMEDSGDFLKDLSAESAKRREEEAREQGK